MTIPFSALRLAGTIVLLSQLGGCASADTDSDDHRVPGSTVELMSDVSCNGPPQGSDLIELEQDVVALVNQHRLAGGACAGQQLPAAPELLIDSSLVCVARAHSRDMAERSYFDHTAPDGASPFERLVRAGYDFRAAGENIAMGQGTADGVVESWLSSVGHCQNIFGASFEDIGVGVAIDQKGRMVWTQVFGSRY